MSVHSALPKMAPSPHPTRPTQDGVHCLPAWRMETFSRWHQTPALLPSAFFKMALAISFTSEHPLTVSKW